MMNKLQRLCASMAAEYTVEDNSVLKTITMYL